VKLGSLGVPLGARVHGVPGRVYTGSMRNLMMQGMLGINSTKFSAPKINTGLPNIYEFISGSYGVFHGLATQKRTILKIYEFVFQNGEV
jgi:hypothetical protein